MRILVTGATGFIGKHLLPALREMAEVHIVVRASSNYDKLNYDGILIYDGNQNELSDYLLENKFDGIIHLAALVNSNSECDIAELVSSNITFPTQLLDAAVKSGVDWFINIGTYWQNYNSPDYAEIYNPVNLYAASKKAFIDLAKYYTETSGIRFTTLKLCDTYGLDDTRKKIVQLFQENAGSIDILSMSPGEQLIDILHVDDVCAGIISLMRIMSDNGRSFQSEYTLNNSEQVSLRELASIFEKVNKVKLNINWGGRPYRPREVMKPYIGNPVPGWQPKIPLETGLKCF